MKRISALLLALALCLGLCVPASAAAGFSDVADSSPFAAAVGWAVERGITNGTTPTTFGPGNTCATSHILTFLWRANGRPGDAGDEKAAVSAWASGLGIDVSDLSAPCTRAAAVTYMWKAAGSPAPANPAAFADVPATAEYAQAVAWAVERGVTKGTGETAFSPDSSCTRGQIVTFLYRALGPAPGEEAPAPKGPEAPAAHGALTNGKPVTEENVRELMGEVEAAYPEGTAWGFDTRRDNTAVIGGRTLGPLSAACGGIQKTYRMSMTQACGGFAGLVSDAIFGGGDSLPARKLDDVLQVRPGDILALKDPATGKCEHIGIAVTRAVEQRAGDQVIHMIDTYDGNMDDAVGYNSVWVRPGGYQIDVWTRYPD